MSKLKKQIEEPNKKSLESEKILTPESFMQGIADHLGVSFEEAMERVEKFGKELDKLKNKK